MRTGVMALVIASIVGLVLASAATAKKGTHVSGEYTVTNYGVTNCAPVGSSLLRCETSGFVSEYTGDMTGSAVVDFTQVTNCKTGRTHGKGLETFTGAVNGVGTGTLTWHDHFHAVMDCETFELSDFALKATGLSGTGDLAGLHGEIDFTLASYDGTLH